MLSSDKLEIVITGNSNDDAQEVQPRQNKECFIYSMTRDGLFYLLRFKGASRFGLVF